MTRSPRRLGAAATRSPWRLRRPALGISARRPAAVPRPALGRSGSRRFRRSPRRFRDDGTAARQRLSIPGSRRRTRRLPQANLADLEECLDTYSLDIESRDPAGNTLLCLVVQQNERGVAKYLLRRGADINAQNFVGNAPLHFAFGYSYDDLGNYLLSKGANPDLTNAKGETCYEFNKMDH